VFFKKRKNLAKKALPRIELLIIKVDGHMRMRGSVKFARNIKVRQPT